MPLVLLEIDSDSAPLNLRLLHNLWNIPSQWKFEHREGSLHGSLTVEGIISCSELTIVNLVKLFFKNSCKLVAAKKKPYPTDWDHCLLSLLFSPFISVHVMLSFTVFSLYNMRADGNLERTLQVEGGLVWLSHDLVDFLWSDHHSTGEAVIFCCHE